MKTAGLAVGIVLCTITAAQAVDITACDQEVPAGQVGMLTTDLDCGWPAPPGSYGVELGKSATLDLQGHTITGGQWAVYCPERGRCTVTSSGGKGTLAGAEAGIWAITSKIYVTNVRLVGNAYAIANNPKTTLTDVDFVDNGFAITTRSLRGTNVTQSGSCGASYCFDMGKARIDGLVVTNPGTSGGNVFQVAGTITLRGASVAGDPSLAGIIAKSIRIYDSAVTGHGFDLGSRSLRAINTSCDVSKRFDREGFLIGSGGVCAGD
jgi:hypothetical protein